MQEAFLRAHRLLAAGDQIREPKAFLTEVTTRLAIDHLRSARVRRERYVGPWLPEPLVADDEPSPEEQTEELESLSMMVGDGGGKGAVREPVTGVLRVARFLVGLGRLGERQGLVMEPTSVNGQPGAIARGPGGPVLSVLTLDIVDGRVAAIRAVVNPEKLQHLER